MRSTGRLALPSFPTRRSSDLPAPHGRDGTGATARRRRSSDLRTRRPASRLPRRRSRSIGLQRGGKVRSEEHTSELQSQFHLVCRLLLEKKKRNNIMVTLQEVI